MNALTHRGKMFSLVESYKKSGLTRQKFCARHRLRVSTLDWWRKKRSRVSSEPPSSSETPSFIPLPMPVSIPSFEFVFSDGALVRIPGTLDKSHLVQIVHALRGV